MACACLLAAKPSGAFAPQHRPFGSSSSRLSVFLRDNEDGPSREIRDRPQQPQQDGGNDARKSPPRNSFFDRADATRFDLNDDLQMMRHEVAEMEVRYEDALHLGNFETAAELRAMLRVIRGRDAELVYSEATCQMNEALADGDDERVRRCRDERDAARKSMPQFNLHGLWVGKYGSNGYEMVNVTYAGDTLVATKVTGDRYVPRGELSFTVDLQPRTCDDPDALPPVELEDAAAAQWGSKFLPRFVGRGHVADEEYEEIARVEGQLVLIGDYFSFAWVPQKHQIFFGRPSGELALRMLRDYISKEDEAENRRAVAERMYSGNVEDISSLEGGAKRIFTLSDLTDLEKKTFDP